MWLSLLAVTLLGGCGNGGVAGQSGNKSDGDSGNPDDVDPPVIDFTPFAEAQSPAVDLVFNAVITDASGLISVKLYYRPETSGSKDWSSKGFIPGEGDDEWKASIPADELKSAGIYYYLEAVDLSQNDAVLPSGATTSYHVRLSE